MTCARTACLILSIALSLGCSKDTLDVDLDAFMPLPAWEQLNFSNVHPAAAHRYWELRQSFGPGGSEDRILGAGGIVPRAALEPAVLAALDSLQPQVGFSIACLPGFCFKFIAAVNGTVRAFATHAALLEFLGPIDSQEEAALLIDAHNYYWAPNGEQTGVRTVSGGWELVALQLVKDCSPVQTDRVHLLVRPDGSLHVLGREVYEKLENACV